MTLNRRTIAAGAAAVVLLLIVAAIARNANGGARHTAIRRPADPSTTTATTVAASTTSTTVAASTTVPATTTSVSPATSAPLPPPTDPPTPTAQAQAAATGYVTARENAPSSSEATSTSWLAQAQPFLTPAAYASLMAATADGSAGYVSQQMHQSMWNVATTNITCVTAEQSAPPTSTTVTLACTYIDTTVMTNGQPVPAATLPTPWALNGTQPPALLAMQLVGTTWLVAADHTGQE